MDGSALAIAPAGASAQEIVGVAIDRLQRHDTAGAHAAMLRLLLLDDEHALATLLVQTTLAATTFE